MNHSHDELGHGPALTLATSEIGQVTLCPCGNVTVTMQCVSVRFEPDAFRALARMLGASLARIDGPRRAAFGACVAADDDDSGLPSPWPRGTH